MDVTINVVCVTCGVIDRRCFKTGVIGLVVNQNCDHYGRRYGGKWIITHVPTGRHLGYFFDGPEQAMYAASLLGAIDWTADMLDVANLRRTQQKVTSILGPQIYVLPTFIPLSPS